MSREALKELSPEERVAQMKDLLRQAMETDLADAEVLGSFIDLYDAHNVPPNNINAFYASLDLPEHQVIFGDDTFDLIVEQYDALGGIPRDEVPEGATAIPSEFERTLGQAYLAVAQTAVLLQPGPPVEQ